MSLPILRDYQGPCVGAGLDFFASNRIQKPRIMVAPTAAGKSIIIAAIAAELPGRVLVLQPSVELLVQNFDKYLLYDTNVSAYSASVNQRNLAKVTFATIGTITKVPQLFNEFSCLIIDECHLASPDEMGMMGSFLLANPQLKILGLTATPYRLSSSMSGSKLVMMHNSHIYKGYQHIIQIQEIAEKFWAKMDYIQIEGPSKKLVVNSTGANYTDKSLELYGKTMDKQIKECIEKFEDKPMLVFVPSTAQAKDLARRYKDSAYVDAKTPKPERKQMLKDFKAGLIKRIFNFGILGVGYDHPELEVLVDAIPTLSLAREYQRVGRLTRMHPEGQHVVKKYIDLAGNTKRFGKIQDLEIKKIGTTHHVFSGERKLTGELMANDYTPPPRNFGAFEDMVITFGKNKGKKISECEIWWMSWALDNISWDAKLIANIRLFLDANGGKKPTVQSGPPADLFAPQ